MSDWISVKDGLPVRFLFVLVFENQNSSVSSAYLSSLPGKAPQWNHYGRGKIKDIVTHWMPYPKGPK